MIAEYERYLDSKAQDGSMAGFEPTKIESLKSPAPIIIEGEMPSGFLERRVAEWIRTRIGADHIAPQERAIRLLEEAVELAQAEGIPFDPVMRQIFHVYGRPAGQPQQEAGGVAVTLLGWCAAYETTFREVALREIERIEAKPVEEIRGSLARKADADLVVCVPSAETKGA